MPGPTSTTIFRPVTRFFKVVLIYEDFARKKKQFLDLKKTLIVIIIFTIMHTIAT